MPRLHFDAGIVTGWRRLPLVERVGRNVENLRRCVVPWEELRRTAPDADPERRLPLVFTHIKKTGGTTLQHLLAANYHPNRVTHVNAPTLYAHPAALHKLTDAQDEGRQASHFVVMGHHKFGDVLYSLLQPRVVHATLLRHPVDRVLSHWRAVHSQPGHPVYARVHKLTLAEFLDSNPVLECQDAQAHRLAGTLERACLATRPDPGQVLETAKDNLLRTFSLFGVTEEFDGFLLACQRLLGWRQLLSVRQNVTAREAPIAVGEADIERIRACNRLDLELHAFALGVFRERQAQLGIGAAELAAHRDASAAYERLLLPRSSAPVPGPRVVPASPREGPVRPGRAARHEPPPLVITGRFRSGSTLLWQVFDRSPRHVAYYEPCHDNLLAQILHGRPLASHLGVGTYWSAYLPLLDTVRALHRPAFGYERLLLEADDEHPALEAWLDALVRAAAPRRAVLKFNRFDLRLPWLRARFPDATVLHIVRSPREAWASMVRHLPAKQRDDPDHLDMYDLMQWSAALADELPFLIGSQADSSYARHYLLWGLSGFMATRHADVSIRFDEELLDAPELGLGKLARAAGLDDDELATARSILRPVERGRWRPWHPDEEFCWIETRCDALLQALGLAGRFGLDPLAQIRAGHAAAWQAAAAPRPGQPAQALLAACSALRAELTRLLPQAEGAPARACSSRPAGQDAR
jgi:hypothetical protein